MSIKDTFRWIKMALRSDNDAATHYDILGAPALLRTADGRPTLNMGYWRDVSLDSTDALWEATAAMFNLVGKTAELGAKDESVLDVGCGVGTNAIYCVQTFALNRMVGLNISPFQLGICRELAAAQNLQDRIAFEHGSATRMPFSSSSFDKIISLEAAFHFSLREDFFSEAYRVLKPGGLLTVADMIVTPPRGVWQKIHLSVLRRSLQIPKGNVYGIEHYRKKLEEVGFEIITIESITDDVLPPYAKWVKNRSLVEILDLNWAYLISAAGFDLHPWNYIVVKARKRS